MKIRKNVINKGFTMIELLAVIAIIAILSGIGFGTFVLLNRNASEKKTKIMIENISSQLSGYVDGGGVLPDASGGIGSTEEIVKILAGGEVTDDDREPLLTQADPEFQGRGKMVQEIGGRWVLIDGFGNEMFYRGPNDVNRVNNVENGFDLWSEGADGGEQDSSDEDDITNW